jgi:hypothetical protein
MVALTDVFICYAICTFGVGLCGPYSYFGNIQSGYEMLSYLHGANPGKHSSVVECREARTTYEEL